MHPQPIGAFLDLCAEFAGFGCHRRDAIGFFHAPTADVAQGGGAVGVQAHDGQRHGRVRNMVAVQFDTVEPAIVALGTAHLDPVVAGHHVGAHAVQRIGTELHSHYMISYKPSNGSEGGYHTIEVTVNRSDLICKTRPGYYIGGGQN